MHHRFQFGCYYSGIGVHPHDNHWKQFGRLLQFFLFLGPGFRLLAHTISFYRDRCLRYLACADAWHGASRFLEQGMFYGLLLLVQFTVRFLLFLAKFDLFDCRVVLFSLILLGSDLRCLNIRKYLSVFLDSSWTHRDPRHEIVGFSWFFKEFRFHFLTLLAFFACSCIGNFSSMVSRVLFEIISLHIFSSFDSCIFCFLFLQNSF